MSNGQLVLDTLVAAFEPDPLYRWLYPDASTRPQALRANLALTLELGYLNGEVHLDPRRRAVAIWTSPGVELLDDPAPFVDLLDRWAPLRRTDAVDAMATCQGYADSTAHMLHVLAVHPEHQGQGLGAEMLAPFLAELDATGSPAYLESSNIRNIPFYRRHGFETLGEVPISGGPIMRPMRRPATLVNDLP